jgi:uncharacterized protein YycO
MLALLYLVSGIMKYDNKGEASKKASGSTGFFNSFKEKESDKSAGKNEISFRDGDVVFQKIPGETGDRIAAITASPVTHCGIVIVENDEVKIIDAADVVKSSPVKEWISNGVEKKFALARNESIPADKADNIIKEAEKMKGKPYDFQYEWDEEKVYCSELVYKSYERGAGIKLCGFKKLGELEYRGHEEFIKTLMDGQLPLDRQMITPADIYTSGELKMVYNDFKQ